ncbi:hypothetical protein TRAPUB_13528 [Trametes pubescens]|uniref:Uncharacterized protein n=1 Tax=Trametes pubescens TaxID=154538 RepID=A0A1M2VQZ9_TRAPU|nr:hypothetical protein TRAPUB_13528 [Trametes pubescens]
MAPLPLDRDEYSQGVHTSQGWVVPPGELEVGDPIASSAFQHPDSGHNAEPNIWHQQPRRSAPLQFDQGDFQPSYAEPTSQWSQATGSSEELGLDQLEDAFMCGDPSDTFMPGQELPSREEPQEIPPPGRVDKGKGRATNVEDGASDDADKRSNNSVDEEGSTSEMDTDTPQVSRKSSYGGKPRTDDSGTMNPDVALLMLQKLDAVIGVMRECVSTVKESCEGSKRFQETITNQLMTFKGALGTSESSPGTRRNGEASNTSKKTKSTTTKGSDRKVAERLAKLRGDGPPAADEQDAGASRLRERVRYHLRTLLKCQDPQELAARFPPLTDEEVESYMTPDGKVVCSPDNYRIDFEHPWKKFKFNIEAREVAIRTFVRKAESGAFANDPVPPELLTPEAVGKVLDVYMNTLRRTYRDRQKPPSQETLDEAKRRASQTSRTNTIYRARRFITLNTPRLRRHACLFERLSAVNMSGDETDGSQVHHPPVYRIVIAVWQSLELRTFLWILDLWYIERWENPPHGRRTGGNPPRTRVLRGDSKRVRGVAPVGLWRNCYNAEWLATLSGWEVDLLEIVDEDYPFGLHVSTAGEM